MALFNTAIEVVCKDKTYQFWKFENRDEAFSQIEAIWHAQ